MTWLPCLALCGVVWASDIVKIDPDKTGEPISPLIYGQFVEHVGRSVYGGLWAEMLEDRKFFFPITDKFDPFGIASDKFWDAGAYQYLKASPWQVIGPPGTVTMEKAGAFCGEHSPEIHLPGGISQGGLALVGGRAYVGRIVLSGDPGVMVGVALLSGDGHTIGQVDIAGLSGGFRTYPLQFAALLSTDNATLQITGSGKGTFKIGCVSLMPADNIDGWRLDTLLCLKELNSPVYRWPGGNFVSGYDWHDGVGDRDHRPPRHNPAWKGVEANDVGIHEFMGLMKMIGAQAYVAVNTGLGTVQQVHDEVEYIQGAPDSPMGKLRAANGHPEPFGVKLWAVGNEMYGDWQLGHMPVQKYIPKHNAVADAIWQIDPTAQLVASGNVGDWDEHLLAGCADHMNLLSEHTYVKERGDVIGHARELAVEIARIADAERHYRDTIPALKGKNIRLCMDEWNYWYGDYLYGELGCRYRLKDGLGVAIGLHEFFKNSDLFYMANYAQTVNVLGAIKTTRTAAALESTGLALAMYRAHFGTIPIQVVDAPADLDVSAAWAADRSAITISIVNCQQLPRNLTLDAGGLIARENGERWRLSGPDIDSYNQPGQAPQVTIQHDMVSVAGLVLPAPPLTAVIYRLQTL
ncbi:MAG TPA: alpha-L-arabinofuranosidase C-terminal domain-containing protein [Tepidisphaeraceae bacterium]|nr:alpha-L-arabinofuranosidase C-terminal domain-containing protein [Tepidisphaeraceae bacterium]